MLGHFSKSMKAEHVPFLFEKGPEVIDGNKIYMFMCRTEVITGGRKCTSITNGIKFNGEASTGGFFKVGKSSGFTNLYAHAGKCVPEWSKLYDDRIVGMERFVQSDKISANIYGWIDLITSEDLPFSHVEKEKGPKVFET